MMLQFPERKNRFLGGGGIEVSFEFFPPKTATMEDTLWRSIKRLEPLNPVNVAVTYGAGGSARTRTHSTIARILKETSLAPAAHLTCVSATRVEVDAIVRDYWDLGVRHIVALRGDPPGGPGRRYETPLGGYINAADLVKGIKAIAPFEITVAAHPEKHPNSPTLEADFDMLKAKIDAGATSAISQFFFDNNVFFRYLERARARGITIPILPGVMPIQNFSRIASFAAKCGIGMPGWLGRNFEGLGHDRSTSRLIGAAFTAKQVLDLADQGINRFHFFTLNRADIVYAICHLLGLRPVIAEPDQIKRKV
jgi:methylenetetrahydrofolate reductase (NADPH)